MVNLLTTKPSKILKKSLMKCFGLYITKSIRRQKHWKELGMLLVLILVRRNELQALSGISFRQEEQNSSMDALAKAHIQNLHVRSTSSQISILEFNYLFTMQLKMGYLVKIQYLYQ